MKKLVVEYKEGFQPSKDCINTGKVIIMFTPAINKEYYIMRVVLYKDQALVAFPKFGLIGVGFAIEEGSWNTNLPYQVEAERLYKHIRRKALMISHDHVCLQGIYILQAFYFKFPEWV